MNSISANQKGTWRGAFRKKIWSDNDCENTETKRKVNLKECMDACAESVQCNVINFAGKPKKKLKNNQCFFRKCVVNGHIPEPTFSPFAFGGDPNIQGYCMSLPVTEKGNFYSYL